MGLVDLEAQGSVQNLRQSAGSYSSRGDRRFSPADLALPPAPGCPAERRSAYQPLCTSMRRGRNAARLGMRTASTPSFRIASI
jgi:hypothetical protein